MKPIYHLFILVILFLFTSAQISVAKELKHKKHPRRAELKHKERRQERKIASDLRSGKITKAQARKLREKEKKIKRKQRAEVKANGGYLTKAEQRQLNRELIAAERSLYAQKSQ